MEDLSYRPENCPKEIENTLHALRPPRSDQVGLPARLLSFTYRSDVKSVSPHQSRLKASAGRVIVALRDGIVQAAVIERVAPPDALDRHPTAPQESVFFDGLVAILRAGWLETTTRWEHYGKCPLVHANQSHP